MEKTITLTLTDQAYRLLAYSVGATQADTDEAEPTIMSKLTLESDFRVNEAQAMSLWHLAYILLTHIKDDSPTTVRLSTVNLEGHKSFWVSLPKMRLPPDAKQVIARMIEDLERE